MQTLKRFARYREEATILTLQPCWIKPKDDVVEWGRLYIATIRWVYVDYGFGLKGNINKYSLC